MYYPSISEFREFYSSPLGALACRRIRNHMGARWSEVGKSPDMRVLGVGYAGPYLMPYLPKPDDAIVRTTLWAIPAAIGSISWPHTHRNRSLVFSNYQLPLPDNMFDRILLMHSLEFMADPQRLLRECWRILAPEGRLMVVVPNRLSYWAQTDKTPFGYGHPYHLGQLKRLLEENMFQPTEHRSALYMMPSTNRIAIRTSEWFRNVMRPVLPLAGGVWMLEASKHVIARTPDRGSPVVSKIPAIGKGLVGNTSCDSNKRRHTRQTD